MVETVGGVFASKNGPLMRLTLPSFGVDKKIVIVSFSFVGNGKNRTILIWQYHVGPSASLNGVNQFRGGDSITFPSCCFVQKKCYNNTRIRVVLGAKVKRTPCSEQTYVEVGIFNKFLLEWS
jgi:hypothetical protein